MNDSPFRPDAADRLKRGDLRNMRRARCLACFNEWWAPVIGRCPKCRAEGALDLESLHLGAPRV
jgi:hypothetical protein